jgi:hypothetical protein
LTELKDKIENALNEARILILGAQVLLGFQYRSVFESGFKALPIFTQYLKVANLSLMLVAVGLLLSPGTYHQIIEGGNNSERLHHFTMGVMEIALFPFAAGLGIDFYIIGEKLSGSGVGMILGVIVSLIALFFWYGLEAIARAKKQSKEARGSVLMKAQTGEASGKKSELKDKIKHVLTEARMVLPGAQAMLGFQFAIFLMETFDKIPTSSKYIHLISLGFTSLSIILLMTPAAYHRIVEEGENTEHFHQLASRMVLSAMIPLALALAGDFFVVVRQVTSSVELATVSALIMVTFFYGLWFGFTLYRKNHQTLQIIRLQE